MECLVSWKKSQWLFEFWFSLYLLELRRAPEVRHDLFVFCEFDHPYTVQLLNTNRLRRVPVDGHEPFMQDNQILIWPQRFAVAIPHLGRWSMMKFAFDRELVVWYPDIAGHNSTKNLTCLKMPKISRFCWAQYLSIIAVN